MSVNIKKENIQYDWPTLTPEIEELIWTRLSLL